MKMRFVIIGLGVILLPLSFPSRSAEAGSCVCPSPAHHVAVKKKKKKPIAKPSSPKPFEVATGPQPKAYTFPAASRASLSSSSSVPPAPRSSESGVGSVPSSSGYGRSSSYGSYVFHGTCQNKALLSQLFPPSAMTCGSPGWTFPGLIWGDCPITACILKTRPNTFGGSMDF